MRRVGLAVLLAAVLLVGPACDDLLQEPDTGIATMLTLARVSGADQVGTPGQPLAQPLRVQLSHVQGDPTGKLAIEWVVVSGGGRVEPRYSFTDPDGFAETTWILGPGDSRQRVEARFASDVEVFEAQVLP